MTRSRTRTRLLGVLVPAVVVASTLVTPAAQVHAAAAPTITITSPAENATVTGLVGVGVVSTTDPASGDYPWSTSLYLDGQLESGPQICNSPVGARTCTQNHLLATDGLNGKHTIQAQLTTFDGVTVSSAVRTLTMVNAAPTVSITSPTEGASVSGSLVPVATAGALAPGQSFDFPQTMTLVVDGVDAGFEYCRSNFGSTCNVGVTWHTSTYAPGRHTLQARLDTLKGNPATSPPVHVTLVADTSAPVVTVVADHPTFARGSLGAIFGTVTSSGTGLPLAGAPVTVSFTPYGSAAAQTVTATTADDGSYWALTRSPLTANTRVDASYGTSSATAQLAVTVPISCTVPSSLTHGVATVSIGCHTEGLAWHSVVALRIGGGAIPHATQFGRTDSHGNVSFSVTFQHPGQQLEVRATTATTSTFVASTSPSYTLLVR